MKYWDVFGLFFPWGVGGFVVGGLEALCISLFLVFVVSCRWKVCGLGWVTE